MTDSLGRAFGAIKMENVYSIEAVQFIKNLKVGGFGPNQISRQIGIAQPYIDIALGKNPRLPQNVVDSILQYKKEKTSQRAYIK